MKIATSKNRLSQMHTEAEHEQVVVWSDPESNYRGIIAIHSTVLGPAVGGTRVWNYPSEEAATLDALRLSRAMSYKNALAGLPFCGGKDDIVGNGRHTHTVNLFRHAGRIFTSLGGLVHTA